MKILLVITDNKGKSVLFILDNFRALTLKETINYIKKDKINDVHVVETKNGAYIRSNHNQTSKDNLDSVSVSISALTGSPNQEETAIINKYLKIRQVSSGKEEDESIYIDGEKKTTEKNAATHLKKHKTSILAAAKYFKIDAYLLGAILIDEYARLDLRDKFDWMALFGENRSVGVAQIKIETARELIEKGYYNPNPRDEKLSKDKISRTSNRHLYKYVNDSKHSICFAAAKIKQLINSWAKYINLGADKPRNRAILGALYSLKRAPHPSPKVNLRGAQIAKEFYKIAKRALK